MRDLFRSFANRCADIVSSPAAFLTGAIAVVIWGVMGPAYHYSDTWQLVINTGTSVVTFLMVFLLQATQARDTRAMQLKLDELLRAVDSARNGLVRLEDLSDEKLDELQKQFSRISQSASGDSAAKHQARG